jgi:hypothetical protein
MSGESEDERREEGEVRRGAETRSPGILWNLPIDFFSWSANTKTLECRGDFIGS